MQLIINSSMLWPLCSVHRMDAPARVEFVLGLICLPSVFFAIIEIQVRRARRGRSGSRGKRVAEDPRGFRSMRGQHGKPMDNPCRSLRLDSGTGLDCPRSSRIFRAAAVLKPLRPNIPACQAIARGEPAFVLIAARRSERIRTSRILNRFQFGGGSGDLVQDPRRRTKKTAGITEPAKFITNREE